ncbi:hypothetical protein PR048_006103 [Dryococelus australis]|uniref:Uncharacterized protein n=1 Tax=Dryococelus australis TaxID=614101 RepID=A0ABQ9IA12_9NEOP|nr:hypothetical protein PR048_006103 [Dryococelus australis]
MPYEMIEDWSKGLANFFFKNTNCEKEALSHAEMCYLEVHARFIYGIRHYLNLLKAPRPKLKSTKIQDVLSLMKFMKPENAQWLQNLVDAIRMDDENNEDDVFSEDEEMVD